MMREGLDVRGVWTGDDRLVALAEAGRRLGTPTSLPELYTLASQLALDILDASSASIARIENDRGVLRVLRNVGQLAAWEEPEPEDETYEITDFPLLASTAEEARPWVGDLGDPQTGDGHRDLLLKMGMASSISLPILVHGTIWGEIGAARRSGMESFGEADIAAGEAFCGLLSASLARIAERDQLLDLAYRDALTGLGNRRAVDDRLEELLATPGDGHVAVVLCDVNGLKAVNDTYGHDAGDQVLRQVGSLLTQITSSVPHCRAARLGGDEFCLLIEDISEIDLQRLTERLTDDARELPMGAGLACGWARSTRTTDGATPREAARALLRLADAAQYRAKRAGKDALAAPRPPETADAAAVGLRLVELSLLALESAGDDVAERLELIARTVADVVDAAGWCVSISEDEASVVIVRNDDARRVGASEGPSFEPGATFDLDQYPATDAALLGGTLHATLAEGHPSERRFLAMHGYDEIIAAGTPVGSNEAWLVEIMGDALSAPLAPHLGTLRALVALAVAAPPRASSTWIAQDIDSAAS